MSYTKQQIVNALLAADIDLDELVTGAEKPAEQPKADVKFRTAKQIQSGKAQADAIYARYRKETGKSFKAMTPAKQRACKAEVKAVWAALEGTRKTKVA